MAQDTTPALVIYPGQLVNNTYRTNFEFAFDKGFYGEVKVAFVRRGLTEYSYDPSPLLYDVHGYLYAWNGGVYTKTETTTTETPLYDKDGVATGDTWTEGMYREPKNDIISNGYVEWKGNPITESDIICIVRETQKSQPYTYPNNQKHIERALDNLSRQIQELQLSAENALHVDPSWNYTYDDPNKMDPIAWLQTIVRSKGLTLRELRIDNNYIEYTTDDPDSLTKTWNVIAGVKAGNGELISHFRETKVLAEDGITWIPFLEYSTDGGNNWKAAGKEASELEHLYVKKAGDTMTGTLNLENQTQQGSSYATHITFKTNDGQTTTVQTSTSGTITVNKGASFNGSVSPLVNGTHTLGGTISKWYTAYVMNLNNGSNIAVPATATPDTLALKSEVDLAANSGDQLTNKGVWYAKMYATTVVPSAEDGTNYADFSQTDSQDNPIIVLYERQNGAWVQTNTITPPADYNGYVTVTSKIWDIVEQSGQQGGKVLWSHNTKTFTPYPQIISFENASLTGTPTAPTLNANSPSNQIVNKQTLENALVNHGTGRNVGDTFLTKRTDNALNGAVECNGATYNTTDFTGAEAIGQLLEDGRVPYVSLTDYAAEITAKGWCDSFGWDGTGTTAFRVPTLTAHVWQNIQMGIKGAVGCSSVSQYGKYFVAQTTSFGQQTRPDVGAYNINVTPDQDIVGASVVTTDKTSQQRVMVQLAVSATDEALETCTSVLAMLANADFVIERQDPTAANNYTWYKKYKSGRVEQGGIKPANTTTVDFPVTMANTEYWYIVKGNFDNTTGGYSSSHDYVTTRNTTGFVLSTGGTTACWEVKGMAQQ